MTELESLRPVLEAIPADEIEAPKLPMAVALQEAHNLEATIEADGVRKRIIAVGLNPVRIDALPAALVAVRQAQSQWMMIRDRANTEVQREREARGMELRRELLAVCRWNFREINHVQGGLDAVAQRGGIPGLVQDLQDLALLIEKYPSVFEDDETFDAPARVAAARQLASEIGEGVAGMSARDPHEAAKLLRDRAFTHLDRIVTDIRAAGRYAYRDDPRRMLDFTSDYLRRGRRRRARRRREQEEISDHPPAGSIIEMNGDPSDAAA